MIHDEEGESLIGENHNFHEAVAELTTDGPVEIPVKAGEISAYSSRCY